MKFFAAQRNFFSRCFGRRRSHRERKGDEYNPITSDMTGSFNEGTDIRSVDQGSDEEGAPGFQSALRSNQSSLRPDSKILQISKLKATNRKTVRFAEFPTFLESVAWSQSSVGSTGSCSAQMCLAEFVSFMALADGRNKLEGESESVPIPLQYK